MKQLSWRQFLAVMPAILGLLLAGGLSYWGRYQYQIPKIVLVLTIVGAFASLILAWRNVRWFEWRITRLEELEGALSNENARTLAAAHAASSRAVEYARLLAETSAAVATQLEQVRLPLHILLDAQFGALNDNQEELLAAATLSAQHADDELRRLREIADIDRGALTLRAESIRTGELVDAILPPVRTEAARAGVRLSLQIDPALPRILGDRTRTQDALRILLVDTLRHTEPGTTVAIHATSTPKHVCVSINAAPDGGFGGRLLLAERLIVAQGGTVETTSEHIRVLLRRDTDSQ